MEQAEKMCDSICLMHRGKEVIHGPVADVKRTYGSNSVHIDFEGNGEFLKHLPLVRRADVYQNYAELELTDISRSNELFAQCAGILSIRTFEIVEPSLHSIFIRTIGAPEATPSLLSPEHPVSPPATIGPTSVYGDARLKKGIRSLVLMGVLLAIVAVRFFLGSNDPWWIPPFVLFAFLLVGVRFVVAKAKVKRECASSLESKEDAR
jgi:hypothetical protein